MVLALACAGVVVAIAEVGKRHTRNTQLSAQSSTECESDSSDVSTPMLPRIPFSRLRKPALIKLGLANGISELDLNLMTVPALRARLQPTPAVSRQPQKAAVSTASQTAAQVAPFCLLCTCPMVARRNSETRQEFWGCSLFPDCKGSRPMVAGK
jgi:hypothetical protein